MSNYRNRKLLDLAKGQASARPVRLRAGRHSITTKERSNVFSGQSEFRSWNGAGNRALKDVIEKKL